MFADRFQGRVDTLCRESVVPRQRDASDPILCVRRRLARNARYRAGTFVALMSDEVGLDGSLLSNFFVHRSVINVDPSSIPHDAYFSRRRSRAAEGRSWAATAASLAPHPVGRPPPEIHHRQNPDAAWLDLVEKRVGKSAEEPTTNGTTEDHPGFGLVLNGLQAPVDLLEE